MSGAPGSWIDARRLTALTPSGHVAFAPVHPVPRDCGIPTEEALGQMRAADPSVRYLVDTSKGRIAKLEKDLASKGWQQAKDDVHVKLLPRDGELYVLARSLPRRGKQSAMQRKKLNAYWARLK
jgi:hypothetical protein